MFDVGKACCGMYDLRNSQIRLRAFRHGIYIRIPVEGITSRDVCQPA